MHATDKHYTWTLGSEQLIYWQKCRGKEPMFIFPVKFSNWLIH